MNEKASSCKVLGMTIWVSGSSSECRHAVQNLENSTSIPYPISRPLPKQIFIKDYPISPRNFGQKLRKDRLDMAKHIDEANDLLNIALCLGILKCKLFRYHLHNETIHPIREKGEINAVLEGEYATGPGIRPIVDRYWIPIQFWFVNGIISIMRAHTWISRNTAIFKNWVYRRRK